MAKEIEENKSQSNRSLETKSRARLHAVAFAGWLAAASAIVVITVSSCATFKKDGGTEGVAASASLAGDVSLKADRSELDELRKDIPDEVKKQNDEVALVMSFLVRDSEEEPNRLRDRFNTALRKKRETVDKNLRRSREDFSTKERGDREAFLKKTKEAREDFLKTRKRTSDERKRFFDDQDDRRKSFFSEQQEKRKDFEMKVQDSRKELEDSIREKQNAFNQEWRAYQARYIERKKQNELKKKMEQKGRDIEREGGKSLAPSAQPVTSMVEGSVPTPAPVPAAVSKDSKNPMDEFDQIPAGPATPLKTTRPGP